MAEEEKNKSDFKFNIEFSLDDLKNVINSLDDDDGKTASEIKKKLIFLMMMRVFFATIAIISVIIFPYEVVTNTSFGFLNGFSLMLFSGTCALIALGVEDSRKRLKRRLTELSAETPPAP